MAASVGEPACSRSAPSVSAADFSALYERCMKSGLKARVAFDHAAGRQTVTVMCTLPASTTSAATAGKRRRCRRRHTRRGRAAADTAERDTHIRPQPSSPTAAAPACDDPPPRSTSTPPPHSPPVAASPLLSELEDDEMRRNYCKDRTRWTTSYSHPSPAQPRRLRRMCRLRRHRSHRRRPRRHPSRRLLSSRCRQLPALRLQHPRSLTHRQRC